MSNRDSVKNLIDRISERKLVFIIPYLQRAAIPDETLNAEALEVFAGLENDDGHVSTGSTEALIKELMED